MKHSCTVRLLLEKYISTTWWARQKGILSFPTDQCIKKVEKKINGTWNIPLQSLVISTKIKIIYVVFCVREVLGYL